MLDATHFCIPSDGWLQITGTLPESIICTWGGEKDQTAADEYATESHVWDVTQMYGTKDCGTEGHYYRAFGEGMRGADGSYGYIQDAVNLVDATGDVRIGDVDLGTLSFVKGRYGTNAFDNNALNLMKSRNAKPSALLCAKYAKTDYNSNATLNIGQGNNGTPMVIWDANHVSDTASQFKAAVSGIHLWYQLNDTDIQHFTSLFLSASSTSDELTAMPADAIPLSEIQFADNNWSIEEAVYDAPEADANGVITPTAVTGQMRIQYSLDAAEQIDTLKTEYAALEARVTALENA